MFSQVPIQRRAHVMHHRTSSALSGGASLPQPDKNDQREKCRAAMYADPAWQKYLDASRALMETQDTRIMKVAPFFVERLKKMLAATK